MAHKKGIIPERGLAPGLSLVPPGRHRVPAKAWLGVAGSGVGLVFHFFRDLDTFNCLFGLVTNRTPSASSGGGRGCNLLLRARFDFSSSMRARSACLCLVSRGCGGRGAWNLPRGERVFLSSSRGVASAVRLAGVLVATETRNDGRVERLSSRPVL